MVANKKTQFRELFKRYWHWLLVLYVPLYLAAFFLIDNRPMAEYWVVQAPLDDVIPFCRFFIVPYCLWYPLLFGVGLYLLICEVPHFKKYMYSLMLGLSLSLVICLAIPNGQHLRPEEFAKSDIFTWLVGRIYAADTCTNVLPSMHVAGSVSAAYGTWLSRGMKGWLKGLIFALAAIISMSTVFVKQHSVLDIFAGLALGILCSIGVEHASKRREKSAADSAEPETD